MPLTQKHAETPTLTPEQVASQIGAPFLSIMSLPAMQRAEVLASLEDRDVRVRMHADSDADIPVLIERTNPGQTPERFVIPGRKSPVRSFPLRQAVYVAANLDYPQFGGASLQMGKRDPDGVLPIVPVEGNPGLIAFTLVLNPE